MQYGGPFLWRGFCRKFAWYSCKVNLFYINCCTGCLGKEDLKTQGIFKGKGCMLRWLASRLRGWEILSYRGRFLCLKGNLHVKSKNALHQRKEEWMQGKPCCSRPCDKTPETQRMGFGGKRQLFPLGKFRYMGAYLGWFCRQNIRKYVNVLPAYLRQYAFLVSK